MHPAFLAAFAALIAALEICLAALPHNISRGIAALLFSSIASYSGIAALPLARHCRTM